MSIQSLRDDENNKFIAISGTPFNSTGSQVAVGVVLCGLESGTTSNYLPLICDSDGFLINQPAV